MTDPSPAECDSAPRRLTHIRVDLDAITHNLQAIRRHCPQSEIMAVVKANAYGHGLVPVAQHLVQQGVNLLGVAFLEEGLELRRAGINARILVFGGIDTRQVQRFIEHQLELTAPSIEKLHFINDAARKAGRRAHVHLKVDTGMERIGTHWYSAERLLQASLQCRHLHIAGVYSHLATADESDLSQTRTQLQRFQELLDFYPRHQLPTPPRHIANSGAILQLPEARLDIVRPGILLYGIYPSPDCQPSIPVSPALSLHSHVVYFKVVRAGSPIGYGATYTPDRDTRIVTIPIGYGDGYFRALSNCGSVLIRGQLYPIVGRVCMDQIMVDIGPDGTAYNGDPVTLIGRQLDQTIPIQDLATRANTISYEILTHLNTRIPRLYHSSLT